MSVIYDVSCWFMTAHHGYVHKDEQYKFSFTSSSNEKSLVIFCFALIYAFSFKFGDFRIQRTKALNLYWGGLVG